VISKSPPLASVGQTSSKNGNRSKTLHLRGVRFSPRKTFKLSELVSEQRTQHPKNERHHSALLFRKRGSKETTARPVNTEDVH
jgi:hypothetical protein